MFPRLTSYFIGSILLLFSEGLYDFAIAIYAYQISGKASVGAITYGIGYFAEIAVSLLGGGYLDRFSKISVFTVTILIKVTAFLLLVFYGNIFGLHEAAIWGFALVIDAIHHFSKLNNTTAIADLFEGPELIKAHGGIAALQGSARIVGPLLGGALVSWCGAIDALLFCAGFQMAALFFFFHAFKGHVHKRASSMETVAVLGTMQALKEVWRSPTWRRYFTLDAFTTLFSGTAVLLMVPLMKELLQAEDRMLGTFFAIGAAGSIAGGLFMGRLLKTFKLGHWMGTMVAAQGLCLGVLLHSPNLMFAAGVKFVLDFAMTSYFRTSAIFLQSHSPEHQRGTYYCASDAVSRSLGLVGVVSAGFLFDMAGPFAAYGAIAISLLIFSALWARSFPRTRI